MPWLEYGGRLRKLPEGVVVIGSGEDATVRVEDAELMPRHIMIHPRADGVEVCPFSADVVLVARGHQVSTAPETVDYGEPILAGAAEFRVWQEQPGRPEAAPAATQPAFLIDEDTNSAYPLDRLSTTIGRASANIVPLVDPSASRFHAQIRREAGGFGLHVTGSAGGTVNGRRVSTPCYLADGDRMELAHGHFRFIQGAVPEGVRIIPPPPDVPPELGERPTMVRERTSLSSTRPATPPRIMGTAVAVGIVLLVVLIAIALIRL